MDIRIDTRDDDNFKVDRFMYHRDSVFIELKGNCNSLSIDMTYDQVQSLIYTFKSVGLVK